MIPVIVPRGKKRLHKKEKIGLIFPVLIMLAGAGMMIYMINVEHEPGAFPLLIMCIGAAWLVIAKQQIKTKYKK